MAVQQITGKIIKKFDVSDGNFQAKPKPVKEVDGNKVEEDIYGEKKHTYQPDNGNLQMNEFMTGVLNKLDGMAVNPKMINKSRAVEVDIKREIAIGKLDTNAVKSEEYVGKVNNKKDKLKALRHKKLYQKQMGNK